ncbi:MAG: hypothetical protein K0Q94_395 [Paenibacillus sp.]|uniref:glycoside hydrolase family 88 protein n=1 Tax=Paenibacillus sp. GCM10012303 TaxID=3317340 RepID=UPI0029EEA555|nr:hypothetical protein [Paenibacillus sp.]
MFNYETPVYYTANLTGNRAASAWPEGKRLPRGWTGAMLGAGSELYLEWKRQAMIANPPFPSEGRLRITAALDYRSACKVDVLLGVSGEKIGSLDIRYAYTFQPFELILDGERTAAAFREGVVLRIADGGQPLWIFDELQGDDTRRLFVPHLLVGGGARGTGLFVNSFASLSSLQPFGWLEGCVLDGLYALRPSVGAERIDPAIGMHLRQYVSEDGSLRYEDLHGQAADDKLTTIEATLPLAVIAKLHPDHPLISRTLSFWEARLQVGGGAIVDGDTITAEGVYTVAYPLAVVAAKLERAALAERAIGEVTLRRDALARGTHLFLRYNRKTGAYVFRNWSRAYAWYMLGMTRTWHELKYSAFGQLPALNELEREIRRIADVALLWVQPEGVWTSFLDDPDTGIETSGSAGIAAALALGAKEGLLERRHYEAAEKALAEIQSYLTPDGILSGVTQHNAGGIELQTCGYRVLSQMGMGLLAQLYASLDVRKPE